MNSLTVAGLGWYLVIGSFIGIVLLVAEAVWYRIERWQEKRRIAQITILADTMLRQERHTGTRW